MSYHHDIGGQRHRFGTLAELLARATPLRSGDLLAGVAARSEAERVAAKMALADLPLKHFLDEPLIDPAIDEVSALILSQHDPRAFAPVAHLTVGGFRDWLLSDATRPTDLALLAPGLTPEMAAAVSKLMRNQDLVLAARKCRVVTAFRTTVGLPGRLAVRLQPNHGTDDPAEHRPTAGGDLHLLSAFQPAGRRVVGVHEHHRRREGLVQFRHPARHRARVPVFQYPARGQLGV